MKGGRMMSTSISPEIARELASTVPAELACPDEPVYLGEGFDMVVYRWGAHTLRFPIRREAVELLENEYRWVPDAAEILKDAGFAIPTPRFRGTSSNTFGYPWLLVDYVEGDPLHTMPNADRGRAARDLATALALLHQPAPAEAPISPYRGVPLSARSTFFSRWITDSPHEKILRGSFEAGIEAAEWEGDPVWCHGDPHPANIMVKDGKISGLIDFGNLSQGDPAVDYAGFYLGFTAEQRADARVILRAMGAADDNALWQRAKGWAAAMIGALLASGNPALEGLGADSAALLADG